MRVCTYQARRRRTSTRARRHVGSEVHRVTTAQPIDDLPAALAARTQPDEQHERAEARLDEVEAVARIGSYATDITAGH